VSEETPHSSNQRLFLHYGDLSDGVTLINLLRDVNPDEVYNLGAQSHVRVSFDQPVFTGDVTGVAAMRLLEAARAARVRTKVYQASSSEMFGATPPPQDENSPLYPRSPYGIAKVYAYWATRNYREAYGIFAVNGILFNHESPRRGATFVTRKVTRAVARIQAGIQDKLYMGNLDAIRDWGYAPDYVEGMWQMMQAPEPQDYVLATNTAYSVRDFVQMAFDQVGLDWEKYIEHDERYKRPTEVDALIGDYSKAKRELGWEPKVLTPDLVKIMVDADVKLLDEGLPSVHDPNQDWELAATHQRRDLICSSFCQVGHGWAGRLAGCRRPAFVSLLLASSGWAC
jgi:GDPmannose 4,6-dehydratase